MFKIIDDIIRLIKDVVKFVLKIGWKLLILFAVIFGVLYLVGNVLHLI